MSTGEPAEEQRFGEAFADYIGVGFGVPVSNGSAALVVALEALGIGYGDEVLVPGLVWVACASAVARVGATPVLVDVEPDTFCMSPAAAEASLSDRTRAVLLAHLYSSIADLDAFGALAKRHDVALLEDCSQAHGAMWRDRRVGSFGTISTFSFQNSKLLTAGEGGIVLTESASMCDAAQQLRSDGRRWADEIARRGFPDLVAMGGQQGHNHCMTEFQAALLTAALPDLDGQNRRRIASVRYLEQRLSEVEGVWTVRRSDERVTLPTFYHLPLQIDPDVFNGVSGSRVGEAISAEVGLFLEPVDAPLNRHPLYQPSRYRRLSAGRRRELDVARFDLPVAEALSHSCFTIPHHAFLAPPERMDLVVDAVVRVQQKADEL